MKDVEKHKEVIHDSNRGQSKIEKCIGNQFHFDYTFHNPSIKFVHIFREQLRYGYIHDSVDEKVNRSTCTYYVSSAMLSSSRLLNYSIEFEADGKRDAVVTVLDQDNKRQTILACEWEWETESIFGEGKELQKLIKSTVGTTSAAGLLVCYCTSEYYPDYLRKIAEYWKSTAEGDFFLIVLTILYKGEKGRVFKTIRTVIIDNKEVEFWEDLEI